MKAPSRLTVADFQEIASDPELIHQPGAQVLNLWSKAESMGYAEQAYPLLQVLVRYFTPETAVIVGYRHRAWMDANGTVQVSLIH